MKTSQPDPRLFHGARGLRHAACLVAVASAFGLAGCGGGDAGAAVADAAQAQQAERAALQRAQQINETTLGRVKGERAAAKSATN